MNRFVFSMSLISLSFVVAPASAEADSATTADNPSVAAYSEGDGKAADSSNTIEEIVVTATRRSERLQDVPLSITAISQAELTQKGIVGFEGIARETPGVVLNQRGDNNVSVTTRGISTNGYQAGLQATTTVYLDELPLTTIGNSVTLNPNLYDVDHVEFLRGPQGTLFGSGSLSGALRILTHNPDLEKFDASALVDIGRTPDGGGIRQRYDGMVNIPLVADKLALRIVGFHRDEDGYIDNIGTGVKNSNSLRDSGGRATLLWDPTDRLSIKLMGLYEDSAPADAALTTPSLGDRKRYTTIPDQYTSKTQLYNATIDYQFDGAHLTSSSSYAYQDSLFNVDLAGTFDLNLGTQLNLPVPYNLPVPFYLFDHGITKTFVEETRLVSDSGGRFDYVVGVYYLHRDGALDSLETSTPAFLAAHGITGLPSDASFFQQSSDARSYEVAGFGELTFHLTDKLSVTGGLRYGKYGATADTDAGYYDSGYFVSALFNIPGPVPSGPLAASSTRYPSAAKTSWRASLTYEPSHDLTLYGTVSTGYRTPVYNVNAGLVSILNPNDVAIPARADSDNLTNYELGLKGHWLDERLTANLAAYYIDWKNLQIQANRPSDGLQFATNVGRAKSEGLEAEITVTPLRGLVLGLNGSYNEAKVTELSAEEAVISGAVEDSQLASPHLQGSFFGTYNYHLVGAATGFSSFQVEHVGSFPDGFPNTPGKLGTPSPLYAHTDAYTDVNLQTGGALRNMSATLYVENVGNRRAVTYIHPESFVYSRYTILRPRTIGVRFGYQF